MSDEELKELVEKLEKAKESCDAKTFLDVTDKIDEILLKEKNFDKFEEKFKSVKKHIDEYVSKCGEPKTEEE